MDVCSYYTKKKKKNGYSLLVGMHQWFISIFSLEQLGFVALNHIIGSRLGCCILHRSLISHGSLISHISSSSSSSCSCHYSSSSSSSSSLLFILLLLISILSKIVYILFYFLIPLYRHQGGGCNRKKWE